MSKTTTTTAPKTEKKAKLPARNTLELPVAFVHDVLGHLKACVNERSPKNAHKLVRLTSNAGELAITAFNGEASMTARMPTAHATGAWSVGVEYAALAKAVKNCDKGTMTLGIAGLDGEKGVQGGLDGATHLVVQSGADRFDVGVWDYAEMMPGEYLIVPADIDPARRLPTIPAQEWAQAFREVLPFTAQDNSRYAIAGALIDRGGRDIAVVSTDGHRLSRVFVQAGLCKGDKDAEGSTTAIVRTELMEMVVKLYGKASKGGKDNADSVWMGQLSFAKIPGRADCAIWVSSQCGGLRYEIMVDVIEGNFPPYRDVIPRDNNKMMQVEMDALALASRKASVMCDDENRGIALEIERTEGAQAGNWEYVAKLEGRNCTGDTSESALAVQITPSIAWNEAGRANADEMTQAGIAFRMGFSPRYLADICGVFKCAQCVIGLRGPLKPAVFSFDAGRHVHVLMPVNI